MPPTIERIEVAGPDGKARRLYISGEETPRTTSAAVVKLLGLHPGDEVASDALSDDLARAEDECVRERAMRVMGYRERSAAEVARRLVDDGYPRPGVLRLVERYVELGLIDDARFADMWARSRAAAGFGRRRVSRELSDRGVEAGVAAAALDEAFDGEHEVDRARAALRGRQPGDRTERERLVAKLVRRGFSIDAARRAVGDPADGSDRF